MSKRIRYKEMPNRPGVLESVRVYTSNRGAMYKVRINTNDNTYEIKNLRSEHIYRGGEKTNNHATVKKAAKRHLMRLGVSFNDEDRNRSFAVCPKGYTQEKHMTKILEEKKNEGSREETR